jgi:raffinose/stachyose/melibiose transport system substrate-binding protein
MSNSKRVLSIMLMFCLVASLFAGCSSATKTETPSVSNQGGTEPPADQKVTETPAAPANQKAKTLRFFTSSNDNSGDFKVMKSLFESYKKEVNPNFNVEIEAIPNYSQYQQKLRTYIAGNQTPDMFKLFNGVLSEKLASQGKLVDMKALLKEFGQYDKFNKAGLDFLTHSDGGLYLFPEGRYGEAFWYWKKPFEENNIKVPTTFDEFIQACEILKSKGYNPIAVAGKEIWQIIRYLSFIPLRLTHTDFIEKLKVGDVSFTSDTGMRAANFLHTLGTKGYFQKGFTNMDYTQTLNYFMGGKSVIHYNGTWEIKTMNDEFQKGNIGYFFLPDVAGKDNIGPITSITAGLAYAFNAETFDDTTKDFFKYAVERYSQRAYEIGGFISPINGEVPNEMSLLTKDISKVLEKVEQGGVSWDDKLDPATTELMGSSANELALGLITPEKFAQRIDKAIKENAAKFFGTQK